MLTLNHKIYVAGAVSGAGKTSVCAALLNRLLPHCSADQLSYIKPVKQCIDPQLIKQFCQQRAIDHQDIGPVDLSPQLLQQCYQGEQSPTQSLLAKAIAAIESLSKSKRYFIIDGCGYPGVGSIAGVLNGQIAQAANASVILVCNKAKTGDAIDWMRRYFQYFSVAIIGIIFNKLSTSDYQSDSNKLKAYYANYYPQLNIIG